MAFPSITGTAGTNGTTATTNPVVNLPASIVSGETLVVLIRVAAAGAIGWPGGWTELFDDASDASDDQTAAAWRKADGTEGATITLSSANGKFAALAWRIAGAVDPTVTPPEFSVLAVGTSPNPNPGSLSPTGGAKDYLWLAVGGWEGEQTSPPGTFPANYTLNQIGADSGTAAAVASNCRVAGGGRQLNAATEDPGTYTISVSDDWTATTIAIHPAVAIDLVIQDALHDHLADNIVLIQVHVLAVDDALHAHSADNVILEIDTLRLLFDTGRAVPAWRYLAPSETPASWNTEFPFPPSGTFAITPTAILWTYNGAAWGLVGEQGAGLILLDEGTLLGSARHMAFVGDGVTATMSGSFANVSIPGGGGGAGADFRVSVFEEGQFQTTGTVNFVGLDVSVSGSQARIAPFDRTLPSTAPQFVDEFMVGVDNQDGLIGDLGWNIGPAGTTATFNLIVEPGHPGYMLFSSPTASGTVGGLSLSPGGSVNIPRFRFDEFDTLYWVVRISDPSTDYTARLGIGNNWETQPQSQGAYIEKLSTDNSFFGVTRNGTETRSAALIPEDAGWHTFRIRRISELAVGFKADSNNEVVLSTNIPFGTGTMNAGLQIVKNASGFARSLNADFFSMKLLPQNR